MAATFVFNSRIPQALAFTHQAILETIQEVFELDIKPAAVEGSPVTEEGYLRNLALEAQHKLGDRPAGGTGHNRRTIDVTVKETDNGVEAQLFTQSSYGGYLETGTSKMRAQPYLYPAFIQNIGKLPDGVRVKIQGMKEMKS
jgi:HK97 gp10 family phage protein